MVAKSRCCLSLQTAKYVSNPSKYLQIAETCTDYIHPKTKTLEIPAAALQDDQNTALPPLMNPTMLEATDDLTNLSHLNEPAGTASVKTFLSETNDVK